MKIIKNMETKRTHSEIGKANKRLGAKVETNSANFWGDKLNSNIKRTPRSGAFSQDWPGDIVDLGKSIIKEDNWIIDIKGGKSAVPKRIKDQMEKLKDDAQTAGSRKSWLEIAEPYGEIYIIMNRKNFAELLLELQEWRNEFKEHQE